MLRGAAGDEASLSEEQEGLGDTIASSVILQAQLEQGGTAPDILHLPGRMIPAWGVECIALDMMWQTSRLVELTADGVASQLLPGTACWSCYRDPLQGQQPMWGQ